MRARAALAGLAALLASCAAAGPELEFQELGGRDRVPRRWHAVTHETARPLGRRAHEPEGRPVTVVEFADDTPLLDLDVERFQAEAVAVVRRAGWTVAEGAVGDLAHVEGDLALVGSVTEGRNPAVPGEVVVDLATSLLELRRGEWTTRASGQRRFRVVVPLAKPPPPPPRR